MHTPSSRSFSREVNTKQPTLNIWKWNRTSFLDFPFSTFLLSFFIFPFPPHRPSTLICSSSHSWLWLVYPKHITLKVWIGWKSSSSQFYDDGILEANVYSSSSSSRIKSKTTTVTVTFVFGYAIILGHHLPVRYQQPTQS